MSRILSKLQELVFDKIDGDATLKTLLGGNGKVKYAGPQNYAEYPCVTYQVLVEADNPYEADQAGSNIVNSRLIIQSFVNDISPLNVTKLDDRVFAILNGQPLTDVNVKVFTCYRQSRSEQYDKDVKCWVSTSSYNIVNVNV